MDHQTLTSLLDPAAWPEPTGRVELVQTHVSFIFLTDSHAWKVKKSVDFGFLDFTTLEKRRFFCHEEVRLNRRLSPHVYLGVVPIVRQGGRVVVGGEGEPFEYAVKMVRLPGELMMDRLLDRDGVTSGKVRELAEVIARFHLAADRGGRIASFGTPEMISSHWRENFDQARRFRGVTVEPEEFDFLEGWVERFMTRNHHLFLRRVEEGFIRDCDGDLHAANICLTDPVTVFDCIEFNERFRFIDTAADLAFLLMDLDRHGRGDLRETLRSRYVKITGDGGMLPLLPFYQSQRAFIRGKVESLATLDPELADDERERFTLSARRSYSLAVRYAREAGEPLLAITCGKVGSGKSRLAGFLAERWGWDRFSSDRIRKELHGIPLTERGRPIYAPEATERTYGELERRAVESIQGGRSVVVDATFHSRRLRSRFRDAARMAGARFLILSVVCDEGVTLERLGRRSLDPDEVSDAGVGEYLRLSPYFEPPAPDEGEIVEIDTTGGLEEGIDRLKALVRP